MPKPVENTSADLIDFLKDRFTISDSVDEHGQFTDDPSEIKIFSFNYVDQSGKDRGSIVVSLLDDSESSNSLKIYFGQELADTNSDIRDEWYAFLQDMRKFAKMHLLGFDVRNLNKSKITRRDIEHDIKLEESDLIPMFESSFGPIDGSVKTSKQPLGNLNIVIKHTDRVDPESRGARSRRIQKIYLTSNNGERFLLPFKSLVAARAMARHIEAGGTPYDATGKQICALVDEMLSLGKFYRTHKSSTFTNRHASKAVESARERYLEIKKTLASLTSKGGYGKNSTALNGATDLEDDDLYEDIFDGVELDEDSQLALPHVMRAYRSRAKTDEEDEFDRWINASNGKGEGDEILTDSGNEMFTDMDAHPNSDGMLEFSNSDPTEHDEDFRSPKDMEENDELDESIESEKIYNIPLDKLIPDEAGRHPDLIRKVVEMIRRSGRIDPLEVHEYDGKFYIDDGTHRYYAAKILGIDELPCILSNLEENKQEEEGKDEANRDIYEIEAEREFASKPNGTLPGTYASGANVSESFDDDGNYYDTPYDQLSPCQVYGHKFEMDEDDPYLFRCIDCPEFYREEPDELDKPVPYVPESVTESDEDDDPRWKAYLARYEKDSAKRDFEARGYDRPDGKSLGEIQAYLRDLWQRYVQQPQSKGLSVSEFGDGSFEGYVNKVASDDFYKSHLMAKAYLSAVNSASEVSERKAIIDELIDEYLLEADLPVSAGFAGPLSFPQVELGSKFHTKKEIKQHENFTGKLSPLTLLNSPEKDVDEADNDINAVSATGVRSVPLPSDVNGISGGLGISQW